MTTRIDIIEKIVKSLSPEDKDKLFQYAIADLIRGEMDDEDFSEKEVKNYLADNAKASYDCLVEKDERDQEQEAYDKEQQRFID